MLVGHQEGERGVERERGRWKASELQGAFLAVGCAAQRIGHSIRRLEGAMPRSEFEDILEEAAWKLSGHEKAILFA